MHIDAVAERELGRLKSAGLLRSPRTIEGAQGPEVVLDGRATLCLCSNNYLGLADHPTLRAAAIEAAEDVGFGACASRHITGTMALHKELEARIALFVHQPRALLFSTGYGANLGVIQALSGPKTLVLSDALNHASLIDGCRLGRGTVKVFRHGDVTHVAQLLEETRGQFDLTLVVTESLFSMDGDLAPLRALRDACDRYGAALMVDEAHAIGVLGAAGRGACAHVAVQADLVTGTFGKAFGCSGAFVAGSGPVMAWIENCARAHVFSTAPSPVLAAVALAALDLVAAADDRREQLRVRVAQLRSGLTRAGYELIGGEHQIIPVLIGDAERTMRLSEALLERGVFVHGIRPPTVAAGTCRLRVTPMASHTADHIAAVIDAFGALRGEAWLR